MNGIITSPWFAVGIIVFILMINAMSGEGDHWLVKVRKFFVRYIIIACAIYAVVTFLLGGWNG